MTDYPRLVESESARLAELATGADPGTPVPYCPGWTLADLITHVGTLHRWVVHIVETARQEPIWSRQVPNGLAEGQRGDPAWLGSGARELVATLRETDPDTPVWAWGGDQRVRWWARRMVFELVVHRCDAELAVGVAPVVEAPVAIDGIEEFLEALPHAFWVAKRLAALDAEGATIHLHASDADGEWTLTQGPAGRISWARGHAKGDVAVQGPVSDLLLMLYGRRSPDALTVHGDRAFLDRWLATAAL
ncbi:maleylpyruvate isomerase family mycothiol-dependent enzyme [Nonomuraea sp. NPDC050680]|uniref:maleylpyruvate isomerase family mycothiol-dependent enzyme n=1 Tax=Nonomuraea sp. NPDC050680 TaxID=3154630 RepID=UPI0033C83F95